MGCDIHCYLEYKKPVGGSWWSFGGRINPGRHYAMFGAMAGVRTDEIPHLEPRGVPEDLGFSALDDYWVFITEDGQGEYCTPAQAESWQKYGSILRFPEKPLHQNFVSGPDWHSHSWLNADELEVAIAAYLKAAGFQITAPRLPAPEEVAALSVDKSADSWALSGLGEYWAMLASLRCFEAQGYAARVVFWFDN